MTQYIVALTGGIGSGKSTVASAFSTLGVPLIDEDKIAREVVKPNSQAFSAIVRHFGSAILNADGSLDRSALRARIFDHPEDKTWLNKLLHPLIRRQTKKQLSTISAPYILWVVPLLIENKLQKHASRILVVDVDPNIQILRTLIRDKVSNKQVKKILASQAPRYHRLACADDIIDNNGRPEKIINYVVALHRRYLVLSSLNKQ